MMRLYGYYRSSAAYRARIAVNLKGLDVEHVSVHLVRDGGEQHKKDYLDLNPQGLVPLLIHDGQPISQSLAIIEYLDEVFPDPPFLPAGPGDRAQVRAMALAIACDIHPLNNLRVLNRLGDQFDADKDAKRAWYAHWIATGLTALEDMVKGASGRFCFGDRPGLADICLVPQVYNARRYDCDLDGCPTLVAIDEACRAMPEFADAAPENQPDAPERA